VIDLIARDTTPHPPNQRPQRERQGIWNRQPRKTVLEELTDQNLRTISNPNIAYILLMIGWPESISSCLTRERSFRGVGGICLVLASSPCRRLPVITRDPADCARHCLFHLEMSSRATGSELAGIVSLLLGR